MHGSGPQAAAGIHQGDILAGKYRVERVLGAGGMGVVVAAQDLQLGRKVAIKFLLPSILNNQGAVAKFAQEARAEASIPSEHIAHVHEVGTLENGAPYKVMEFLDGGDLAAWILERGPMPTAQAVDFVLQTCVAVADAHRLGIVHRDLKPANLFCIRRSDGRFVIKVLDFGISKQTGAGAPGTTAPGAIFGSPRYMSPEQTKDSSSVDARADMWALGVILFELLTGKLPFPGEEYGEVLGKILMSPPASLRGLRPEVKPGLEAVILKCLEKDRDRRYANVAELAVALLPFAPERAKASVERIVGIVEASELSASARALPPFSTVPPAPPPATTQVSAGTHVTLPPRPERRRVAGKRAAVGTAAVVAVASAVSVWAFRSTPGTQSGRAQAEVRPPAESTTASVCIPNVTRCRATTPETCTGGQWVSGPVTAGRCDAVCTPASSPVKCNGKIRQTCTPSGQWLDGESCPYVCSEGRCTGVCIPETNRCSGTTGAQTCDSDGQWGKTLACAKSQTCQDGACIEVHQPPAKQCNPPWFYNEHGERVFKLECL